MENVCPPIENHHGNYSTVVQTIICIPLCGKCWECSSHRNTRIHFDMWTWRAQHETKQKCIILRCVLDSFFCSFILFFGLLIPFGIVFAVVFAFFYIPYSRGISLHKSVFFGFSRNGFVLFCFVFLIFEVNFSIEYGKSHALTSMCRGIRMRMAKKKIGINWSTEKKTTTINKM